jgi:hypothetical protein
LALYDYVVYGETVCSECVVACLQHNDWHGPKHEVLHAFEQVLVQALLLPCGWLPFLQRML